jgi:hypothetical protein
MVFYVINEKSRAEIWVKRFRQISYSPP